MLQIDQVIMYAIGAVTALWTLSNIAEVLASLSNLF